MRGRHRGLLRRSIQRAWRPSLLAVHPHHRPLNRHTGLVHVDEARRAEENCALGRVQDNLATGFDVHVAPCFQQKIAPGLFVGIAAGKKRKVAPDFVVSVALDGGVAIALDPLDVIAPHRLRGIPLHLEFEITLGLQGQEFVAPGIDEAQLVEIRLRAALRAPRLDALQFFLSGSG